MIADLGSIRGIPNLVVYVGAMLNSTGVASPIIGIILIFGISISFQRSKIMISFRISPTFVHVARSVPLGSEVMVNLIRIIIFVSITNMYHDRSFLSYVFIGFVFLFDVLR